MNEHLSKYDFIPIGLKIKKARDTQKITREKLAETLDISVRHLQAVELISITTPSHTPPPLR